MLQSEKVIAFVATSDAARARAFYEGVLGLRVASEDDFALVLDAGGTMIRVQKGATPAPPPYTSLGWQVRDIAAIARALKEKGVALERFGFLEQDEIGVWQSPGGAKVAWFKDPDGHTLSLTEL